MTATPINLRTRKKQQTKIRLTQAALGLFVEKGFDKTTVAEISALANVSRRTFFRYFSAKDDVVFSYNLDRLELFKKQIQAADRRDRIAAVTHVLEGMADEFIAETDNIRILQKLILASTSLVSRERLIDIQWEITIADMLIEKGPGCFQDYEGRVAAAMIWAGVNGALFHWRQMGMTTDLKQHIIWAFAVVRDGIHTQQHNILAQSAESRGVE
jgi:AcrR family transcriptional regulator